MVRARGRAGMALVCGLVLGAGCTDLSGGGDAELDHGAPELLILLYDRSPRISDHQLEHGKEVAAERVAALDHGDRIVALEVLERSLGEASHRWSQRVPERQFHERAMARDSVARARFLRDARQYLERFAEPDGRESREGTDLLSTMHLVQEELDAYPEYEPTLVVLSDMLHEDRHMRMEGLERMPEQSWVTMQAERDALPDLGGLCVVVAGARDDLPSAQVVQDFWKTYFDATGADLRRENWKYRPIRLPLDPCSGS